MSEIRHRGNGISLFLTSFISMMMFFMAVVNVSSQNATDKYFSHINSEENILNLKPANAFINKDSQERKEILNNICDNAKPVLISLRYASGGELYNCDKNNKVKLLNRWSDEKLYFGDENRNKGRFFGFIGGQIMSGGDYPSSGLNLRIGTMLYKNKYDVAFVYDVNKLNDFETDNKSMGIIGRALFPLSKHSGWNIGGQIMNNNYSGDKSTNIGLVSGINIYLPQGSFDMSFNFQEKGVYGLMFGYTVFVSR